MIKADSIQKVKEGSTSFLYYWASKYFLRAGDIMEGEKYKIRILPDETKAESIEAYEKVCSYLLQKYCEDCEEHEGIGVSEGIY